MTAASEISSQSRTESFWIIGIFSVMCVLAACVFAYVLTKERRGLATQDVQASSLPSAEAVRTMAPALFPRAAPPTLQELSETINNIKGSITDADRTAMEAWWQSHQTHQMEMWWQLHRMEMWWALRQHTSRRPGARRPSPPSTAATASAAERSWGEAADVHEPPRYLLDTTRWPMHGPAAGK